MNPTNRRFVFSRHTGAVIGKVFLSVDGLIKNYSSSNERYWTYDEMTLELSFLDATRKATTVFSFDGEKWVGTFREKKNFHFLTPVIIKESEPISISRIGIDVIDTCNLSCKNCDHASPYFKQTGYTFEDYKEDIRLLSKLVKVQQLNLLGGEPLLLGGEKLREYIKVAREANFCSQIGIITNGFLLPTLKDDAFLNEIDVLQVSYYERMNTTVFDAWLLENKGKYKCKILVEKVTKFSSGYSLDKLSTNEAIENWKKCSMKGSCHNVRKGKFYLCTRPIKLPLLMRHQLFGLLEDLDEGIDLKKITDPAELACEIDVFSIAKPYKMCKYCDYKRATLHSQETVTKIL